MQGVLLCQLVLPVLIETGAARVRIRLGGASISQVELGDVLVAVSLGVDTQMRRSDLVFVHLYVLISCCWTMVLFLVRPVGLVEPIRFLLNRSGIFALV